MFSASGEEIPDDRGDVEGNKNDKGKILHEYPCTSHKANMCHRRAAATGPCLVCHSCVQDLRLKSEIEREGVFSLSQSATSYSWRSLLRPPTESQRNSLRGYPRLRGIVYKLLSGSATTIGKWLVVRRYTTRISLRFAFGSPSLIFEPIASLGMSQTFADNEIFKCGIDVWSTAMHTIHD